MMDEPSPTSVPSRFERASLVKALVIYVVLACAGVAILLSFIPDLFSNGNLSLARLLVLIAVVIFVVGPVVTIAYALLEALTEAVVRGVGCVPMICFRAIVRFA